MSVGQNRFLSSSLQRLQKDPHQRSARVTRYERLMQVTVRHTYYNASGFRCPDFRITPTAHSMDVMTSIGLLFRADSTGFSILLDLAQRDNFLNFLRSQNSLLFPSDGAGWQRLSMLMTAANPDFVNITEMPICTSSASGTFYFTNMKAETEGGEVLLNPGGLAGEPILPLTGSQIRVEVKGEKTRQVVAIDIAGNVAACQPVYWWSHNEIPESPAGGHVTRAPVCPGPQPNAVGVEKRNPIFLDLSSLPEDKYVIEECTGEPHGCSEIKNGTVVFAYIGDPPMFFLDMLFSRPPGVLTGIYPIIFRSDGTAIIQPVRYFLDLERRSTRWNYYIVSTGVPLTELEIRILSSPVPVSFTGPKAVRLTNGQPAQLFASDQPIPLEERSTSRFQLLGRVGGLEVKGGVLMNRLPVASSRQVIPQLSDYATDDSDRLVECRPPSAGPANNYSDIYVYV